MKYFIYIMIITIFLVDSFERSGLAADDKPLETGKASFARWKYLLSGWRSERQKLSSYEVRIKLYFPQLNSLGVVGSNVRPTPFTLYYEAKVGRSRAAMNPGLSLAEVGQYLLSLGE